MLSTRKWLISIIAIVSLPILAWLMGPAIAQKIAYQIEKGKNLAIREDIDKLSQADAMSVLFSRVAQSAKPAVVVIRVRRFRNGRYAYSQASGVIVDAKRGHIITNYHVVDKAEMIDVVLHDQRVFRVQWYRGDKKTDLAVLKITAEDLIACPFGDSDQVDVGHWVLAMGAPMDLPQTITAGIISAKGRSTNPLMYQNYLQTDAAINRGNSGGPLLDTKGRIIGINTSIISKTSMNGGISMAIPSNMVRNVIRQLIEHGVVIRGYLGINYQSVSEGMREVYALGDIPGVLVTNVSARSPAQKAGLRPHDFIYSIDGREVEKTEHLKNLIAMLTPGKRVKIELIRDGKNTTAYATIASLNVDNTAGDTYVADFQTNRKREFGLRLRELTPEFGFPRHIKGVYVAGVLRNGSAAYGTPRPVEYGSVITHVGKVQITGIAQFNKVLNKEINDLGGARLRLISPRGISYITFVRHYKK